MSVFTMRGYILVVLLLGVFMTKINLTESKDDKRTLSRRKRYAVFPEGSTWSIAICTMTQAIMPTDVWTEAINWGISYNLPNDSATFDNFIFPHHVSQRSSRSNLYEKMEMIMRSMGFDGRSCIYRTLCEASRKLAPRGSSLSQEILRIVFQYPLKNLLASEPEEHRLYHRAFRVGKDNLNEECAELFPHCPFSLIDVALNGLLHF